MTLMSRNEIRPSSGKAPTDRIWGTEVALAAGASGPVVGAAGTTVAREPVVGDPSGGVVAVAKPQLTAWWAVLLQHRRARLSRQSGPPPCVSEGTGTEMASVGESASRC